MFKLIGIVVFVAVIVIDYPSLKRWYSGEASPEQTLQEMRNSVGQKLRYSGEASPEQTLQEMRNSVGQKLITNEQGQPAPAAEKKNDLAAPSNESEAEKALRKLVDKK
jgi:hypothetical protein